MSSLAVDLHSVRSSLLVERHVRDTTRVEGRRISPTSQGKGPFKADICIIILLASVGLPRLSRCDATRSRDMKLPKSCNIDPDGDLVLILPDMVTHMKGLSSIWRRILPSHFHRMDLERRGLSTARSRSHHREAHMLLLGSLPTPRTSSHRRYD